MITNILQVPTIWRDEVARAEERARAAGAEGDLLFKGIGAYGVVLCDHYDHAWKVFHLTPALDDKQLLFIREALEEEYEWLRDAAQSDIAENVAKVFAMHPEEVVLERECIIGDPSWKDSRGLHDLHVKIEKAMEPFGWTSPEFKEDSYIYEEETGIPHLVDISMAQRIGMNLATFVEDVIEGKPTHHRWHDLAFFILREIPYGTIPEDIARNLLERLVKLDPQIRKSFTLPQGLEGRQPRSRALPNTL